VWTIIVDIIVERTVERFDAYCSTPQQEIEEDGDVGATEEDSKEAEDVASTPAADAEEDSEAEATDASGGSSEGDGKPPFLSRSASSADAGDSLCDLRHWVHGVFNKDVFVPTHMNPEASMTPPKAQDALNQKFHWFTKKEAEEVSRGLNMMRGRTWVEKEED
jgi:hypothetical protein